MQPFLACDWGTTQLRAWVVGDDGRVARARDFALGVSRLQPGEAAARFQSEVRPALEAEALPALLCGMIGSTLGWVSAPYLECPLTVRDLAGGLIRVEADGPPVHIVPGARGRGFGPAPEVMRGEETQVFGWLAGDPARRAGRRLICHPGTHAKWIIIQDGRIERFLTAMTGELFAVLGRHSVLRSEAPAEDEAAFLEGVKAAGTGNGLATRLFSARSRVVAGDADPAGASSYLSGLLIGAEVASAPDLLGLREREPVDLVGDPRLCRWYGLALSQAGWTADIHDGDTASLSGLIALHQETAP